MKIKTVFESALGDSIRSSTPHSSIDTSPMRLLPAESKTACQQIIPSPANGSTKYPVLLRRMSKLGKKADKFANGVQEHVRLGPKITEIVKGKLMSLGVRILQVGGMNKIFKKLFRVEEGERLLKSCQCYLSTTAGPIAGLLFISTRKIAFCSQRSIKFSSPNGNVPSFHYKVLIPVDKITSVNQGGNVKKQSQKYIEVVTVDKFDFWFMGFLNYQKAFHQLQQTISQRL